ncbi:hypothetical protein [Deinococcus radiotolerans]|uniref:AAA+ ATPase domain-containing protein n=1 Tax=Deinococcus radiotolerans TaxID=1309407 RepID=A0ABQ2FR75_9DEIO|nr:hypothetical protein [Deinococcus radiotolerans]GGL18937.1 hypothetical protein GCM10010844_42340 [Deinococcus radiotolerans]
MNDNAFVAYLNRYTTASSEHEAAFDEFTSATPTGIPSLSIPTRLEAKLLAAFHSPSPPTVILTGNAGDGKTYLCRKIVGAFRHSPLTVWPSHDTIHHFESGDVVLTVVKDLSELSIATAGTVLAELSSALTGQTGAPYLIAANEGRLRAVLEERGLSVLAQQIDHQLRHGPDLTPNAKLLVIDLNRVATSQYIGPVLDWMTADVAWSGCGSCPVRNTCPMADNAAQLRQPGIKDRLAFLYGVLEQLDIHVTFRDMLIHLAYTITGGLSCTEVKRRAQVDETAWQYEAPSYAYYSNAFGESAPVGFRRKTAAIRHLRKLNVGQESVFDLDHFIVGDDEMQPDLHAKLFGNSIDLGGRLFEQDRQAYLRGLSATSEAAQEFVTRWLGHCRRKAFFTHPDGDLVLKLLPFQFLKDYLQLIDQAVSLKREHIKNLLILGLNRAFSGLYLTDRHILYVTAHPSSSLENAVPAVLMRIAETNIDLVPSHPDANEMIERWSSLTLRLQVPGVPPQTVPWNMNLLRFEYVMRRAYGSTPDILAQECELAVRHLKDSLVARLGTQRSANELEFFEYNGRAYQHRRLFFLGSSSVEQA